MNWLAVDIGGANLKAADGRGFAGSCHFALWRQPERLAHELRTLIALAPPCDHLAITMTGELADCFATKSEGVRFILDAVRDACDARHTRVYLTDGRLVSLEVAARGPQLAAASNWHALARYAGRFAEVGEALLIDIGSTTTDIVPLRDGSPCATAADDTARLICGELVYSGVERSPVCAVASSVPYRGKECPLAQEFFATMRDVYVILGEIPEDAADSNTADGQPATKRAARSRLARSICADGESFHHKDAVVLARAVADSQLQCISGGIKQVVARMTGAPESVIVSGQGEFIAKRAAREAKLAGNVVSLAEQLGGSVSRCGPAHALAVLAREAAET